MKKHLFFFFFFFFLSLLSFLGEKRNVTRFFLKKKEKSKTNMHKSYYTLERRRKSIHMGFKRVTQEVIKRGG